MRQRSHPSYILLTGMAWIDYRKCSEGGDKGPLKALSVLTLLLFVLTGVNGQEDSTRSVRLENIVIRGNRLLIPFDESSRNIDMISRETIRRLPAQSIPEVLSYVPGVDIRQRGPLGVQADIGIRGGSFEQTLILINGIKLTDPQTGHHSLNLPLPLSNIERVEVLKGPGARIFGQNAFSGAVNFITRIPDERSAGIHIYGGHHASFGGTVEVSLPGRYGQYFTFSRNISDGYRHNTDFSINNFFYQSSLSLGDDELEIMAGLSGRKFGANGFYASPDFTEQYEEVQTALFSVSYRKRIKDLLITPRISLRRNRDNYFLIRNQPGVYENLHLTHTGAFEVNSSWWNAMGQTGMGIELRREFINGDWIRDGEYSKSNLNGFSRSNFGIFLEHQFTFGALHMTPGLYINAYSDFDWDAFPGIDLGYKITPTLKLYGNIGKSFRVPTFYDMYYQSPVEKGNANLTPEEAISYESGLRFINQYLNLEANLYYQNAKALIDWVYLPETDSTSIWVADNFTDVRRNGIEIAGTALMKALIDQSFFINSINASYHYIRSDWQEKALITRYTLENIRHQLIVGINHKVIWKINHQLNVRYIDRENMAPYWLFDNKLYWEEPTGSQVFVEITNLGDTEYMEVMTPMPGRWIRAGFSYTIGF